ncbi:T9SS type A sorting domain-containing protein [candidate division KSB1 bacterium]|nr:T9SS type A sorting domain-containing protein [candidate division KSB1 bacterium]
MIKKDLFLAVLLMPAIAFTASLTVEWDANYEKDLIGYRIYWGNNSGQYNSFADVQDPFYRINELTEDTRYYIAVTAIDLWGNESSYSREVVAIPGIGMIEKSAPATLRLGENYPNPFNPLTTIEFDIPEKLYVTLAIYNAWGQMVKILEQGIFEPDTYISVWNGTDASNSPVAAGVYFCRLDSPLKSCVTVMTLLK